MNKKIAVLATLFFAGSTVASNQDNPWYAGARIGATHYSDFDQNLFPNADIDDDNLAGGLFLGYNLNDWFAIEGGYTYLGKIEIADNAEISQDAIELVGKFTWQATESFDLFAKAGGFIYKTKGKDQLSGLKERDTDGTAGVGVEYHFTNNLSARLEYQYYHHLTLKDEAYTSDWDTHLVALGLVYSWGQSDNVVIQDAPVTAVVEETPVVEEVKEEVAVIAPVVVEETKAEKIVNETAEVYFDTKSNDLSAASIEQLQPIIAHLKDYPSATLVVVGHTDSRGSSAGNQKLSEKRAKAVSSYLVKEYSIDASRITTSGEGELSPIADNTTKEGQAKNRRVSVHSPSLTITEK